tara:strand:+ start:2382 stop:3335 length:954 start_codon:yes stop_codon:yes gene_type:complete
MKILANDGISTIGIKALEAKKFKVFTKKVEQEKLTDFINKNDIKILLVRSATKAKKDLIDKCPNLKIIGRGGVGMDNIDVEYARKKGIEIINTPASSSSSVAELVFSHFFSLSRFLFDSNRKMPLEGETKFKELKKKYNKGNELRGKRLGIIGFGRIGQEVAKIGIGLGMDIIAHDMFISSMNVDLSFFDKQKISFKIKTTTLNDLLINSDFITIHIPKINQKPIITKKEFKLMKNGVVIVNTSRGGIIDEEALLEYINAKKVKAAGLDVFINEPEPNIKILMNENVSLSPHIGGSTIEAQNRIGLELAEKIIKLYK